MDNWRTAIATSDDEHIWNRGYDVTELMTRSGFTQTSAVLRISHNAVSGRRPVNSTQSSIASWRER